MRFLKISLFCFVILVACNSEHGNETSQFNVENVGDADSAISKVENVIKEKFEERTDCFIQLITLADSSNANTFFHLLDSTLGWQYADQEYDSGNTYDITPALLSDFFNQLDTIKLKSEHSFELIYDFKHAQKSYKDSIICEDKVRIEFFSYYCNFRMVVTNSFWIEEQDGGWCGGGAQVSYGFAMENGKVTGLGRSEAG